MPLCAVALSTMLQLDQALGVGILLLGCAAGAPFLPKLAELAKGNLPFAVGTMVLLMVVAVGYLPIVLRLCSGSPSEDRAVARLAHAAPPWRRTCPKVAL